jgi:hypothetical protein
VTEGKAEEVPGGTLTRVVIEPEPGIVVPLLLITPKGAKGKTPVVVMVAQGGKAGFLKRRGDVLAGLLEAGVAVCLPDVRGTGETQPGTSADRGSSRTSVSQTNLILGQPVIGSQLRDLRTVIRWLRTRDGLDAKKIGVWGDSFAPANEVGDARVRAPLDVAGLPLGEPNGALLALLADLFEDGLKGVVHRGGVAGGCEFYGTVLGGRPYLFLPHDAVVPGADTAVYVLTLGGSDAVPRALDHMTDGVIDALNVDKLNRWNSAECLKWMLDALNDK